MHVLQTGGLTARMIIIQTLPFSGYTKINQVFSHGPNMALRAGELGWERVLGGDECWRWEGVLGAAGPDADRFAWMGFGGLEAWMEGEGEGVGEVLVEV